MTFDMCFSGIFQQQFKNYAKEYGFKDHIEKAKISSKVIEGNSSSGWFIPPTLVVNPPFDTSIVQEETFGPVMTIHPFKSLTDAIELANKTGYGLSASIFGRNKNNLKQF